MLPFVSIIIPALNEEEYVGKCLSSIKNLYYPKNRYKIILVDNGSRDRTVEIAKEFNVDIIKRKDLTIGTLRNIGAWYAKGQILAFTDADCIVNKDWLKIAISDFKNDKNLVAIGCRSSLPFSAFWLEKLWDKLTFVFDKKVVYLPGRNFLIKKNIFKKVRGFDKNLITAEDPELCYRLQKRGYLIKYNRNLKIIHLGYPKNIFEFLYKKIWYTLSYPYLFRKYGLKTKMGVKFIILLFVILSILILGILLF